jgi:hypothetical protein
MRSISGENGSCVVSATDDVGKEKMEEGTEGFNRRKQKGTEGFLTEGNEVNEALN